MERIKTLADLKKMSIQLKNRINAGRKKARRKPCSDKGGNGNLWNCIGGKGCNGFYDR